MRTVQVNSQPSLILHAEISPWSDTTTFICIHIVCRLQNIRLLLFKRLSPNLPSSPLIHTPSPILRGASSL
ncbi:unnamed protein product [Somion occarium]|uniref:Uncharacterized protein n=1 Tax=Somion occarium TaxID=3059160 RepID=A0ABP1DDJ0_9APHY